MLYYKRCQIVENAWFGALKRLFPKEFRMSLYLAIIAYVLCGILGVSAILAVLWFCFLKRTISDTTPDGYWDPVGRRFCAIEEDRQRVLDGD